LHAFAAFVAQGFRQEGAYKVEGWMGILSGLIWFVLFAGIWTALLRDDPVALERQMRYIVAIRVLGELAHLPTWEVAEMFRMGDVALELIKPVPLPVRILGDFLGRSLFRTLRSLPVYVLIWLAFRLTPPGPADVLLFMVSALLGWVILASFLLSLSLIALWTVQFNEAEGLWHLASGLLSGEFIPLYYLPAWVQALATYLPFAGTFFVPAAILAGTLAGPALWPALALQVAWALGGCGLLAAMWHAGQRKLTVQGG